jgi:hypothetical protein
MRGISVPNWVQSLVTVGIAIIGAAFIVYSGLSVAQTKIEALEAREAKQDTILEKIPEIAADAAAMAATVEILARDQRAFMKTVDAYIKADIAQDSRSHHTHNPR